MVVGAATVLLGVNHPLIACPEAQTRDGIAESPKQSIVQELYEASVEELDALVHMVVYLAAPLADDQLASPTLSVHEEFDVRFVADGTSWRLDYFPPDRTHQTEPSPKPYRTEIWTGEEFYAVHVQARQYVVESSPPSRSWRPLLFTYVGYRHGPHVHSDTTLTEQLQSMRLIDWHRDTPNQLTATLETDPPRLHIFITLRSDTTNDAVELQKAILVLDDFYDPDMELSRMPRHEYRLEHPDRDADGHDTTAIAFFDAWSDPSVLPMTAPKDVRLVLGRMTAHRCYRTRDVDAAIAVPEFKGGWSYIDRRLDIVLTVGESRIKVDGIMYETGVPLHPKTMPPLEELLDTATVIDTVPRDKANGAGP